MSHWISNSPTMIVPTHPNPKANNFLGSHPFSYVNPLPTDQMITSQNIIFNRANLPPSPPSCALTRSLTPPLPTCPPPPSQFLLTFHFPRLYFGDFLAPQPYSPHPHCEFLERLTSKEDLNYYKDGQLFPPRPPTEEIS